MKKHWLLSLCLIILSACGGGGKKNSPEAEIQVEHFEGDDISWLPLSKEILEKISKRGTTYYVEEVAPDWRKDPNKKFSSKSKYSYSNNPERGEFTASMTIHFAYATSENHTGLVKKVAVFSNSEPYELKKMEVEYTEFPKDSSDTKKWESSLDCGKPNTCDLVTKNPESTSSETFSKSSYKLMTLRDHLTTEIVALSKNTIPKLKIKYHTLDDQGLVEKRYIHYYDHSDKFVLKNVILSKSLYGDISKYICEIDRNTADHLQILNEGSTSNIITKEEYNLIRDNELVPIYSRFNFVPSSNPKFVKAHVVGMRRHSMKDSFSQKVSNLGHSSVVELGDFDLDRSKPQARHYDKKYSKDLNPNILKEAETLRKETSNDVEFVLQLMKLVKRSIKSCKMEGSLSISEISEHLRGDCSEDSSYMVNLARHFGFAARKMSGFVIDKNIPKDQVPDYEAHAWAEVYIGNTAWVYVDPALDAFHRSSDYYIFIRGEDRDAGDGIDTYDFMENSSVTFVFDEESLNKETQKASASSGLFNSLVERILNATQ